MEVNHVLKDSGYELVKDLEEITRAYKRLNPREDLALILSASSVTYLIWVHRTIFKYVEKEYKNQAIEILKKMICNSLDKMKDENE